MDLEALGDAAPDGPILGARVENEMAKEALIANDPDVFFTTPHFNGYPAILIQLENISVEDLTEVIVEAWLCGHRNVWPRSTSTTERVAGTLRRLPTRRQVMRL